MPRGRPRNSVSGSPGGALEKMVYEIGQRLGEALIRGVEVSVNHGGGRGAGKNVLKRGPGRPRAVSGGSGCVVPSCNRNAVAKGLCATHYRKARRLGMGNALSSGHLNELAQDGRKTRFTKKAA